MKNDLDNALSGLSRAHAARQSIGSRLGVQSSPFMRRPTRRTFVDYSGQTIATEKVIPSLPRPGETRHFLLDGSFVLASVIPVIQNLIGCPVQLTIATLGLNRDTVDLLCQMLRDQWLKSLRMVLSSYFAGSDKAACDHATKKLTQAGAEVITTRCHAKVQLYKPSKGPARYVIETSANLRSCQCLEAAMLTQDAGLYAFHDQWLTQLFNKNTIRL